jgi:hypothetical protein
MGVFLGNLNTESLRVLGRVWPEEKSKLLKRLTQADIGLPLLPFIRAIEVESFKIPEKVPQDFREAGARWVSTVPVRKLARFFQNRDFS